MLKLLVVVNNTPIPVFLALEKGRYYTATKLVALGILGKSMKQRWLAVAEKKLRERADFFVKQSLINAIGLNPPKTAEAKKVLLEAANFYQKSENNS